VIRLRLTPPSHFISTSSLQYVYVTYASDSDRLPTPNGAACQQHVVRRELGLCLSGRHIDGSPLRLVFVPTCTSSKRISQFEVRSLSAFFVQPKLILAIEPQNEYAMPPAVRGVTWATAVEAIPDHPVPLRVQQARIEANEEELYLPGARLSLAITANPWQQQMINYYFNELVRGHYPFADSGISSHIRHALQRSPVVCGTAALLAQLHHQHVLTDRAYTELRTRLLTQLHDDAKDLVGDSCEGPDNVFAVLQLASCFSFLGGCEERSHYLAQAIKWVQELLDGDPLTIMHREGEWVRFLIKVTMWFDVLDAVTRGDTPQLLVYHRLLHARAGRHMDEGTDPASMVPISGCESGVVLVLAEIAALAAWKRDEKAASHSRTVQLLHTGNRIRNQLRDLPELDAASASTENETTSTRTVERAVFRACAHVYLHTVLSNNKQDCHYIATAAAETISLLARLPTSHLVLRLVVLGICIAGCINDSSETRQVLAGRFTRESVEVVLSSGSSVDMQLSQVCSPLSDI
jgi:hypothetical protein